MPYTDFHYTPTGTGVISGKEVLEQTEDAINDLGGQISGDVQTAIDTANNALNVANTASTDAQNAVNTANTAHTAATNAQNTANAAQNTASNALTAAQNAQNDVNALGNRVTTAENNITQNTTDISGLTTRMGTAEGNITTLQNDVITAQGTATSAQNTATMARQQAYVLRYSSTAITDNSTIAYSTLDNTDNIKADDKIIDVDGKIFSIVSVDSDNSTVTVGSALIDLAVDSTVMHLTGDETSAGKKTFADLTTFNSWLYFTNSSVTKGTIPQSTVNPYRIYFGSGVNYGASLFNIDTSVSNTGIQTLTFRAAENVVNGDDIRLILTYDPNLTQPRYVTVKGDINPNTDNTYNCGSSSKIWKDSYAYHGYFKGQQQGDEYSSNARTNLTLTANRDTLGISGCLIDSFRSNVSQGTAMHIMGFGIKENSLRYEGCRFGWYWNNNLNGYSFEFKPTTQGTNQAVEHSLGTSVDKWDMINGLNPGALSIPSSMSIDISAYITDLSGQVNSYSAPVDGWVYVRITGTGIRIGNTNGVGQSAIRETSGTLACSVPVGAGDVVNMYIVGTSVAVARFHPCLGNV